MTDGLGVMGTGMELGAEFTHLFKIHGILERKGLLDLKLLVGHFQKCVCVRVKSAVIRSIFVLLFWPSKPPNCPNKVYLKWHFE